MGQPEDVKDLRVTRSLRILLRVSKVSYKHLFFQLFRP